MNLRKCDGRRIGTGIAALALLAGGAAFAQDGDRDRERGRGGFDPGEMVRRMDANGNGTLEPSEMEGRSGRFLQRIADEERIDLSRGISVAEIERRIRARMPAPSSGPPPGSPPGSPQSGPPVGGAPGSGPGAPSVAGSSQPSRSAPLVPGFGEKAPTGGPGGFGGAAPAVGGSSAGRTGALGADPESVREAERMVSRYDRNKSGALEKEEWKDVTWSSDPNLSDLNRDGILSKDELIARMDAKRKGVSQAPSGGSTAVAVAGGGRPDDRMVKYADSLMSQNDANRNGILERDEWKGLRGDPGEYDLNRDGLISRDELMARLAKYSSGGDRGDSGRGEGSGKGGGFGKSSSSSAASLRKTDRFLSPLERLPKGLPDWFTRSDANRDGQVMMHEFSSTWSDAKAIEFAALDLDGDGIITPRECLAKQVKK